MNDSQTIPILTLAQLGGLIKGFRKEHGLTQKQLAQRVGLTQAALSKVESNPTGTTLGTLFHILSELDLELAIRDKRQDEGKAKPEW